MGNLLLGLATGIFFGFFLQKGQALKYDKQLGMLRFQDFTILKVMVSAILVGMVGVHFFVDLGLGKLSPKPTILAANILGGSSLDSGGECSDTVRGRP